MYLIFESIGLKIVHNYVKDNLYQISSSAITMDNTARSIALQVFSDKDILNILDKNEPETNLITASLNRLNSYDIASPYIHSIYIYNGYTDTFYTSLPSAGMKSSEDFFDSDVIRKFSNIEKAYTKYPYPRIIQNRSDTFNQETESSVYSFFYYENVYRGKADISAVVVNVSETWIHQLINTLDIHQSGDTFIINREGKLMSKSLNYPMLMDLSKEEYINNVLASNNSSGYFVSKVKGVKSVVTYVSSPNLPDWKFIQITAYDVIVKDITKLKNRTIIITTILLLIGIIYSILVSKRIYKPISIIEKNLKHFEKEYREGQYFHRQEFLRGILNEQKQLNINVLDDMFSKLGVNLNLSLHFKVLIVKIDNFKEYCRKYSHADRELLNFSIFNIGEELGRASFNACFVDMRNDTMAVILNIDSSISEMDLNLCINEYINNIQITVEKLLKISLSIVVSTTAEDISLLNDIYNEALDASYYKLFYSDKCIIYTDIVHQIDEKEYTYPQQKHKFLFENLYVGDYDEVIKLYKEIIDEVSTYSYTSLKVYLLHLAFTVNITVTNLNKTNNVPISYNQNTFIKQLNDAENLEEINILFINLFNYICSNIERRKNNKKDKNHDDLVSRVFKLIESKYMKPDTCIQSISEELGISSAYLGRVFTNKTSKTITECINDTRMEKSCDFLINSEESISLIAEKCGFTSITYFYKVFKKANGITPSEYRSKNKITQ
jgi:AraC-like DNA-binding protein/GGDEF domain-containing protein